MSQETISVIVPVYNIGELLSYSVNSILSQTCQNLELLLVDDGSADDSFRICRELAERDSRIRVIHQENGGVSAARNTGLEAATGKYLAFVDGDDIVAPDYLDRLLEGMKRESTVLSMCGHERISTYDHPFPAQKEPISRFPAVDCAKRLLDGRFPITACCALYLREAVGNLRFPVGIRNNEDKYFLYRYLLANEKGSVAFSNDKLYGYFVREGSATHTGWNGTQDVILVADQIADLTMEQHPEWSDLAESVRLAARFDELKTIIRSGDKRPEAKTAFCDLRREVLACPCPETAGRRLKTEYAALRAGEPCYRLLVKTYYKLNSEERRFQNNERQIRQG